MPITPFTVDMPQAKLDDLRERIRRTRWPESESDPGWTSGPDPLYLKGLARYWAEEYDWRRTERAINDLPNFLAAIDGRTIHFVHIRGTGGKLPLLLGHGWPGSFLEFTRIIPLLAGGFDLVIPSVNGYGFSDKYPPLGVQSIADLWARLMTELGYERFGVHGGDFGSGIGTALALRHPSRVAGLHLNNIESYYRPWRAPDEELDPDERAFEDDAGGWNEPEGAYAHQQRTRPLTLAYGLNDSPVGLCAWLVEKFRAWSDCGGDVESAFPRDELLGHVTLYWLTGTILSSFLLYGESRRDPLHLRKGEMVRPPVGIAHFPAEAPFPPRRYVGRGYNIVHWSEMQRGGHFAAWEEPAALAADIRRFFSAHAAPEGNKPHPRP